LICFGLLSVIVLRAAGGKVLLRLGGIGLLTLTAALVAAALLVHQSGYLSDRAGTIIDTKNMRLDLWRAALAQWKVDPLLGIGSGTYRFYGRQFRTEQMQLDPNDVHNDYLHLLCEYGLVGAAGFLLFFSAHVRHSWRSFLRLGPRRLESGSSPTSTRLALNLGAISALAAYVVHSVVDFNLHIPANALLLGFVFGILANPGIKYNDEAPSSAVYRVMQITLAVIAGMLLLQSTRLFTGEYYAERARTSLRDENPAAAVSLAEKALVYEQQNPDIYFYLGRALVALSHQKGKREEQLPLYENALSAFEKAWRLAPLDGTYPLDLAFTYDEMGRFAEAEWMYGEARSRDPHSNAVSQLYRAHLEAWTKGAREIQTPGLF